MDTKERCLRFSQELRSGHIDVAVLLKPHNVFYFAGYAPVCAGVLLFPEEDPVFCTLWLDGPEARERCSLEKVAAYVYPRETLGVKLIELMKKRKPSFGSDRLPEDRRRCAEGRDGDPSGRRNQWGRVRQGV